MLGAEVAFALFARARAQHTTPRASASKSLDQAMRSAGATKRICAACLLTLSAVPISDHGPVLSGRGDVPVQQLVGEIARRFGDPGRDRQTRDRVLAHGAPADERLSASAQTLLIRPSSG